MIAFSFARSTTYLPCESSVREVDKTGTNSEAVPARGEFGDPTRTERGHDGVERLARCFRTVTGAPGVHVELGK